MTIWKSIDRFPCYEVSSEGQVRRSVGGQGAKAGKVLTWHTLTSTGYPDVRMTTDGKSVAIPVHRLVAWAFLGPRPEGMQIRHLDGNKMNCRVENLAYGSAKENGQDKVAHGTSTKGTKNPKVKLTEEQALQVFKSKGIVSAEEIAAIFCINESTVHRIWRGIYWTHITKHEASNRAIDRAAM